MSKISFKIIFLLFLLPIVSFSQKNFYKLAEKAFANEEYYSAIENYKKNYAKTDKGRKGEILFKVGFCYMKISDYKQAEMYFSKCIKAKYPDPIAFYYLALCKKYLMKYDEAIAEYQNYLREVPDAGKAFIASCDQAKKWMNEPNNQLIEDVVPVNSKDDDMLPVFGKSDSALYFISNRETFIEKFDDGKRNSAIFFTEEDQNGKWSMPAEQNIGNINSNVRSVFYDNVNKGFYFSGIVEEKIKKRIVRRSKIFYLKAKGNIPEMLSFCETDTGSFNFGSPVLISPYEIIFSSDMPGGFGGYDLWKSDFNNKTKTWNSPINLGAKINSSFNEKCPSFNNIFLYFSSDRESGMGGYDLYCSRLLNGDWEYSAENMKYPVNSGQDELGISLDGEKPEGYISSNRDGGKGGFDIYKFTMIKK